MNREIKFRVWDNVDYMSKPFTLQEVQSGKIQFTSDCAVMQFTGLKDKNGKEIYEGDILRMRIYMANDGWNKHEVEIFSQGYAFWFKTLKYPGYTDCLWFHYNESDREIIGNIYENPELLK